MIDPASAVLPVGIWLTLRIASRLGGGTDLDYRRREERAAFTQTHRVHTSLKLPSVPGFH
ncbi:hypothetical protein OHB26_14345 [Nocardia sp. NBC_01503]|uniref:hypothetical protein n=1 Tax=Nocardia sp. NBC_01503 TaxID=2975997 RepID=UPI002E7C42BD|nr:hypothetical protein [Nocardia sp. NBC_01503]WTL35265.1 hypothetical protein OHB26_14345 [Nocardia sp. NBC_01503]